MVSTLVLARLLAPTDFGLVAMATSFIALLEVIGNLGVDSALIQRSGATRVHYDTAWTFNLMIGLATAIVAVASAPALAAFYGDSRVVPILAAMAVASLLLSAENIGTVDFRKEMNFRLEFKYQVGKKLLGFLAVVPLAFVLKSYWALVVGTLIARLGGLLLSFRLSPYRPRISFGAGRELFVFSRWLLIGGFVVFARQRSSDFVIGRLAGPQTLGLFSIASELGTMPATEIVMPVARAAFPVYSTIADDRSALAQAYLRVLGLVALIAVPAGVGLASTADLLVPVLFGPKWLDAIPVMAYLSLYGVTLAIQGNIFPVFLARGQAAIQCVGRGLATRVPAPAAAVADPWLRQSRRGYRLPAQRLPQHAAGVVLCRARTGYRDGADDGGALATVRSVRCHVRCARPAACCPVDPRRHGLVGLRAGPEGGPGDRHLPARRRDPLDPGSATERAGTIGLALCEPAVDQPLRVRIALTPPVTSRDDPAGRLPTIVPAARLPAPHRSRGLSCIGDPGCHVSVSECRYSTANDSSAQSIESMLGQTYGDFELVISDNASSDHTEDVCRDYARRDPRIRYVRQARNLGGPANFRHVFEIGSGEFQKWTTADDYWDTTFIEKAIRVLDERPDVVLCYPKTRFVDELGTVVGDYDDNLHLLEPSPRDRFLRLLDTIGLCHADVGVIRRSAMRRTRLMTDERSCDVHFVAELSLYGKFWVLPEPLYYRRLHADASSWNLADEASQRTVLRSVGSLSSRHAIVAQVCPSVRRGIAGARHLGGKRHNARQSRPQDGMGPDRSLARPGGPHRLAALPIAAGRTAARIIVKPRLG